MNSPRQARSKATPARGRPKRVLAAGISAMGALCLTAAAVPARLVAKAQEPAPAAHAARTIALSETGHLHLTSRHNFTLNEQGSATGTVNGTIYVHLTAVSSSRVTAEVNIYAHGSSISARGEARYRRAAGSASFSGSISIAHGSGSYARVHGSGLSFSGTIAESKNDAIAVHLSGRVSS
ncbi:MAG TPA: hypothetical protein VFR48_11570 [Solirubrobacteraceae bacterium]|nr:hypothetical protein [Solirubrobacteraceae bacterium]